MHSKCPKADALVGILNSGDDCSVAVAAPARRGATGAAFSSSDFGRLATEKTPESDPADGKNLSVPVGSKSTTPNDGGGGRGETDLSAVRFGGSWGVTKSESAAAAAELFNLDI